QYGHRSWTQGSRSWTLRHRRRSIRPSHPFDNSTMPSSIASLQQHRSLHQISKVQQWQVFSPLHKDALFYLQTRASSTHISPSIHLNRQRKTIPTFGGAPDGSSSRFSRASRANTWQLKLPRSPLSNCSAPLEI